MHPALSADSAKTARGVTAPQLLRDTSLSALPPTLCLGLTCSLLFVRVHVCLYVWGFLTGVARKTTWWNRAKAGLTFHGNQSPPPQPGPAPTPRPKETWSRERNMRVLAAYPALPQEIWKLWPACHSTNLTATHGLRCPICLSRQTVTAEVEVYGMGPCGHSL